MRRSILLLLLVAVLLAFKFSGGLLVQGKVVDENGQPVAGASVQEKGTGTATVTAGDGQFRLQCASGHPTLVVSAVGHASLEVKAADSSFRVIRLKASQQHLQEVVVTGYQPKRRADVAGAAQALSGKVAGIQVRGNSSPAYFYGSAAGNPQGRRRQMADSFNTEGYAVLEQNPFRRVQDEPLSTFSIDVDPASYSNVRRYLNNGSLPPAGAVRTEELVNYFSYHYPQPEGREPFAVHTEMAPCPWNKTHRLLLIGLQGKKIPVENLPASNLVFLVDVSGSMQGPDRLGLVKESLKLLVDQLREKDRIALVVYAGNAGLVLPSVAGSEKEKIRNAIDALEAGGSTAGGQGIQLAYKVARENFNAGGNNRIILCTDGDFNVGMSSDAAMEKLIEKERESGVFLTVLGYGMGNYQDSKMQILADKGNGNHAYIDGLQEAKKVLVSEFGGTLFTIAKDVKLQLEFNPAQVQGYRLIGYENRLLNKEDFNDDRKDAGELGSGHTVTALYELIPAGAPSSLLRSVDSLKYQRPATGLNGSAEWVNIKLRYKEPKEGASRLLALAVGNSNNGAASENFRFASAVAEFGMLLTRSAFRQDASFTQVYRRAKSALGTDREGYRKEFLRLVRKAGKLQAVAELEEEGEDVSQR